MPRPIDRRCFAFVLFAMAVWGPALLASVCLAEGAAPATDIEGKILGRFRDRLGFERIFVQLTPELREAQLVAIARAWHIREPEGWFWFLNDGEKADEMLNALPDVQQGNAANYPAEWVAAHSLGHIQMELLPGGGKRWTLMRGAERTGMPLAILDP